MFGILFLIGGLGCFGKGEIRAGLFGLGIAILCFYRCRKETSSISTSYQSNVSFSSTDRISDEGIEWRIGSEKQIDWAEEVVRGTLRRTQEMLTDGVTNGKITDEERVYVADAVETAIVTFDDANWWIDNRNESLKKKLYIILEDDDEAKNIIRKMA